MKFLALILSAVLLSSCLALTAADEALVGAAGDRCSSSISKTCRK